MKRICLDTGILSIFFMENSVEFTRVQKLFQGSIGNTYEIYILSPIFSEIFYHICKIQGKDEARVKILSLKKNFPIKVIDLNDEILCLAGELKCKHRRLVSYIDCFSLAFCSLNKIEFHTTEIKLKDIPAELKERIKIISYKWD
jgi:predicted nucleic acid-binding protein